MYYKEAYGALLVYDISRPPTFESVAHWKQEIDSKVRLPNGANLPVVLVANKCDLLETEVNREELDAFCEQHGFEGWFETSAKLNKNIDKASRFLVGRILQHADVFQRKADQTKQGVTLGSGGEGNSGGCC